VLLGIRRKIDDAHIPENVLSKQSTVCSYTVRCTQYDRLSEQQLRFLSYWRHERWSPQCHSSVQPQHGHAIQEGLATSDRTCRAAAQPWRRCGRPYVALVVARTCRR